MARTAHSAVRKLSSNEIIRAQEFANSCLGDYKVSLDPTNAYRLLIELLGQDVRYRAVDGTVSQVKFVGPTVFETAWQEGKATGLATIADSQLPLQSIQMPNDGLLYVVTQESGTQGKDYLFARPLSNIVWLRLPTKNPKSCLIDSKHDCPTVDDLILEDVYAIAAPK